MFLGESYNVMQDHMDSPKFFHFHQDGIIAGSLVPHALRVSTADVEGAGTASDILIKVFGQKGSSEQVDIYF